MTLHLKDFTAPFEKEFDSLNIDLSKISNVRSNYNGKDIAFIDLVIEGGGVKGVAVMGALYALERLGLRFRKIAGTSAGAINAAYIAAASPNIAEIRMVKACKILINMNLLKFVDGGRGAEAFVRAIMDENEGLLNRLSKMVSFTRNIDSVVKRLGINPGIALRNWLYRNLKMLNSGTPLTVGELKKRLNNGPDGIKGDFQIVTSDITNRRKAIFPRHLKQYFENPEDVLIADLVRASSSIPVFFEPFRLKDFEYSGNLTNSKKRIINGNTTFTDGALVSNFPLGIFDLEKDKIPRCPTFGILFDTHNESEGKEIKNILDFGLAMLETLNDYGDLSYLDQTKSDSRIIRISNKVKNRAIKTIYFNLSEEEMKELFGNGVRAAIDFIKSWNFQEYLDTIRSNT
jgi:NTE family protein